MSTMGAIFAVTATFSLWAIIASEIYDTPWPALTVGTTQILAIIPHWKLFRRIMRAPNGRTKTTPPAQT